MVMTYKVVSATPSPFARKVRIALFEKGLQFELITEVPWHSATITPKFNPLEKLPILILDDGSSVYESSFIIQYLELRHPEPPLIPHDIDQNIAARRLEVLCDGVCDAIVLILLERMRSASSQSAEWIDRQRRKIDGGVRALAELVGNATYSVGDRFSLGDIAVGTALGYASLRFAEFDWKDAYPSLARFSERIEDRASFKETVPVIQNISEKVV